MTPCRSKNVLLTTFVPKNPILQKPEKKNLEPLDLLATVGQPRVCVNVSECVRVCGEERRCGVVVLKSPKKTHFLSLQTLLSLSLSLLKLCIFSFKKKKNVVFVYYKNPKNNVICMHR